MYTCIIVDDQKEAVELIAGHVKKTPLLELRHTATDPFGALAFLDKEKTDIVFLDIEMPEMTGLDFVASLREKWGNDLPKVVFQTGFSDYALEGYEHGVVDYIMKPVTFKRFKKSVDRIINDLEKNRAQHDDPDFMFIESEGEKVRINFNDLHFVEGARNYVVMGTQKKKYVTYSSMKGMEALLPDNQFIRVHKSWIVSVERISFIRGNTLILRYRGDDKVVPIGFNYRKQVLKRLGIA